MKLEREAYDTLINDNSRPCYPIELGFEVFNNSGRYDDLFEYWRGESGVYDSSQLMFSAQLERWKKFRQFQQRNRRYFIFHSRFPEFQQEVLERRQRHRLDGNVQLLEELSKQSRLEDWMQYQDYELRTYERLKKDYSEAEARLMSRRKVLAEAGLSAFEGIQELDFATDYGLSIEYSREKGKAERKEKVAEHKLRLAETKLKAAESDDLGDMVERATWVRLFLREVESAQMRLSKLQRLAENARRDLEPFNRWWHAKQIEWGEKRLEDLEEAKRKIALDHESTEFQNRMKKLTELEKKAHEVSSKRFRAKGEMEIAEEVLKTAQSDDIRETIEKDALIKVVQEEARSAQVQFEEAKESTEKIVLKGKVLSALSSISLTARKMKRHNVLLEWIEQQRQEITSGCADIEIESGQGQLKRASSRVLRNHLTTKPSRLNKTLKANDRIRKQLTTRSTLSSTDSAKVSKALSKRRSLRQKISVPCNGSWAADITTTDSSALKSRGKQAFKVKDAMPRSLHHIHSSRVSKPGAKWSPGLCKDGTKLTLIADMYHTRERSLGTLSTSSTERKARQQSVSASLRRSTRTTKRPERFHSGYM